MNAKTIIVIAGLLICAGCASGDLGRTGCALQAFGSGVQGRPDTACVEDIRARDAGRQPPPPAPVMQCWRDATGQNLYCQQQ
jgi:hypothetical protein